MKNSLLIIFSLISFNCYSAQETFTPIHQYKVGEIIFDVIINNKISGDDKYNKYSNKIGKYINLLSNLLASGENLDNNDLLYKIYHKLIICMIYTINTQNKMNFIPNRLFYNFVLAIANSKNENNPCAQVIETIADLEIVFKLMLLYLSNSDLPYKQGREIIIQTYDKNYKIEGDILIQKCIAKCKNNKKFFPAMHFAIMFLKNLKEQHLLEKIILLNEYDKAVKDFKRTVQSLINSRQLRTGNMPGA